MVIQKWWWPPFYFIREVHWQKLVTCVDQSSFQAQAEKRRGRGGRAKGKTCRGASERERKRQEFEQGMDSVRGREKLQDSVTKVLDSVRGRENTSYIDKVGITHWVTLRQVNHLWSTRENTRDWGIRGWVGGGLDPIDQAYFSSSLQNRYDHKLLTGGSQASFFSFLV